MEVLESTTRRLGLRLARAQCSGRLPSVVAGLVRDGGPVWFGACGERSGTAGPVLADVQYRIGSITKTLTAVLVLQAVRDGLVDLSAPAGEVLGSVGYADRSLHALLAHHGGLQSEPVGEWWERSAGQSWEELVAGNDGSGAVLRQLQQFHYSNLGYGLLGQVVARLHGRSWWECVESDILHPLGMTRTTYLPSGHAAQGYSVHPYARTLHAEPATDTGAMAPAGQLWSTVSDLSRYATFLVEGHPEVLGPDALLMASHPQSGDQADGLAYAHGLGFMLIPGGSGLLVGHTGSMPGFLAGCFVDRGRRTGAVVLANATTGVDMMGLSRDLLELLEDCEPTAPAPWQPTEQVPAEYADLLGVWHWGNTSLVLCCQSDTLIAYRSNGDEAYRCIVREGRVVGTSGYHSGEELRVVRTTEGAVSHLEIATFVYTREPRSL